jgi:hypothetical protein
MENKPTARRGRPRKNPPEHNATVEGESVIANDTGDGEASNAGLGVSGEAVASAEVHEWHSFEAMIKSKHSLKYQIRTVWHPKPESALILTNQGNIAVQTGDCAYQLNTGEMCTVNQPG